MSKKPQEAPKPFTKLGDEFNRIYEIIDRTLDTWIPVLGLDRWSVKVNYKEETPKESPQAMARIFPSWEYRNATIEVFMPQLQDCSEDTIEYVVLHELCHAMVAQIINKKTRIKDEEAVVTDLAKAFMYARHPKKLEEHRK